MTNNVDQMDFATVLANSVHDMKNSLSMLLSTLDEVNGECAAHCPSSMKLTQLMYEGQRVNAHLIQLLSIYKIQNHQHALNVEEHYLQDFLQEAVYAHEPLLIPRGISIEAACDANLKGYFDRELVAGVINNVVNNAYKYSKDKIRLSARAHDGFIEIAVEDNGRGYPPSMLCRNSNEGTPINFRTGSTGLGLYFSSLVAQLHKNKNRCGYISCSNEGIDGGGKFSICVP